MQTCPKSGLTSGRRVGPAVGDRSAGDRARRVAPRYRPGGFDAGMFGAACYYDVIFAGSAVRPEYAAQVIDIFIHGIAA